MAFDDPYQFSKLYRLSKHTRNDAPEIVEALSNPLITKQLRFVPSPFTLSHLQTWFDRLEEDRKNPQKAPLRWAIRETSSGKLIGDLSLKPMEAEGKYQLGYWLAPAYWGKGIMTSAVAAVLEIAKEDPKIRNVVAGVKSENNGSRRVVEKNGFSIIGKLEEGTGGDAYLGWYFGREL